MIRILAGMMIAGALAGAADRDMQRAIEWERHKDRAAERQAAKERRHPSVTYDNRNTANREANDATEGRRKVTDPGPREYRNRDKK
jgi:hypothetical protein